MLDPKAAHNEHRRTVSTEAPSPLSSGLVKVLLALVLIGTFVGVIYWKQRSIPRGGTFVLDETVSGVMAATTSAVHEARRSDGARHVGC
jgi:hypothetical protein